MSTLSAAGLKGLPDRALGWMSDRPHGLWGMAFARVALGVYVVALVASNFADRELLWGAGSSWTQPYRDESRWGSLVFGFFQDGDHGAVLTAKLVVVGLLGLALTAGLCCRLTALGCLLTVTSLVALSPTSTDTQDIAVRILLAWLCLADSSQHWSVDRWVAGRRGRLRIGHTGEPVRVGLLPHWVRVPLHNAALALVAGQLVVIYVMAGLAKLMGSTWRDGTAVHYALNVDVLRPWPGLNDALDSLTPVVAVATWGAVAMQVLFPLFLLHRVSRTLVVLGLIGLHAGIALFLGLWLFSLAMVAADLALISDSTVERLRGRLQRLRKVPTSVDEVVERQARSDTRPQSRPATGVAVPLPQQKARCVPAGHTVHRRAG